MYSVGLILKNAREKMNYTLKEISYLCNIEESVLDCLENDNFHLLPDPFYTRACIRIYAKSLNLEPQKLLSLFERVSDNLQEKSPRKTVTNNFASTDTDNIPTWGYKLDEENTNFEEPINKKMVIEEGNMTKKSSKVFFAFLSLALVFLPVYFFFLRDNKAKNRSVYHYDSKKDLSSVVNAKVKTYPYLEEGPVSDNPLVGQLYFIHNVKKLDIVLKALKGESTVFYGTDFQNQEGHLTLKIGDIFRLDTSNKSKVWFRLGCPSNIEILVNGQVIETQAQDTVKSYRVQLK